MIREWLYDKGKLVRGSTFAVGKYHRFTSMPYSLNIREGTYRGLCIGEFADTDTGKKKGLYMAETDFVGMHYILVGETIKELKRTICEFYREKGIDA